MPPTVLATHWNGSKVACLRGHEFTPQNTYRNRHGWRTCRKCRAYRQRLYDRRDSSMRRLLPTR